MTHPSPNSDDANDHNRPGDPTMDPELASRESARLKSSSRELSRSNVADRRLILIASVLAVVCLHGSMLVAAQTLAGGLAAATLGLVAAIALVFVADRWANCQSAANQTNHANHASDNQPPSPPQSRRRRGDLPTTAVIYAAALIYWLVQLQGLRHAHPAMFLAWIAMSAYLAFYWVLFVWLAKRCRQWVPFLVAAPIAWVTTELIRNYALTGISIGMLGHTSVGLPRLNWAASIGGTYAVSAVLMLTATTIHQWFTTKQHRFALGLLPILVVAIAGPRATQDIGQTPTVALVQRDEVVDYGQSVGREMAIFDAYFRQTVESIQRHDEVVEVVVWPESMLTGAVPWMIEEPNMVIPPNAEQSAEEFRFAIEQQRDYFQTRAAAMGDRIGSVNDAHRVWIVGGCGVIRYGDVPRTYSGIVAIDPAGGVADWYGKRHLVMFGEYIPWIGSIPGLRQWVPPGLGVSVGQDSSPIDVGGAKWLPNICIETAVERVACRAIGRATGRGQRVDAIVTVTNDGWFDHSMVLGHHRRAARMVAVASGRPILSVGNGGPTMVINCDGGIDSGLPYDANETLFVKPPNQIRQTVYTKIGDWPWWLMTAAVGVISVRRRPGRRGPAERSSNRRV